MQDGNATLAPMGTVAFHPQVNAMRLWNTAIEIPADEPLREVVEGFAWTWDEISNLPEVTH